MMNCIISSFVNPLSKPAVVRLLSSQFALSPSLRCLETHPNLQFLNSFITGRVRSKSTDGSLHGCDQKVWKVTCPQPRYKAMATLETLNFDNLILRVLPIDPIEENYTRQVAGACFSKVKPTPVDNPKVVAYSAPAMDLLDLNQTELNRPDLAEFMSGNKLLPGAETAAHCYCGHQFGNFAGQLGDGAAMYMGEVVNKKGERWEIQLKGTGLTPYSRQADGRKVLRSTIREFLGSEAMHHLGIPTTRAGTCITSDTKVVRDIFYDGRPIMEQAAVVLRIAPSFIRFGSFEICKETDEYTGRRGPSVGKTDILETLLDYVVRTFYPQIWEAHSNDKKKAYLEFYREVIFRTAQLVAEWQCVGWCHGVLNTDNMSIVGLTIDYGPYGFMDGYDPDFICNGSDDGGRYTYEKQPTICGWNCFKLAEALDPLISMEETKPVLEEFMSEYDRHYLNKMRKKFGLKVANIQEDKDLISGFLETMQETGADFTNSFRCLSGIPLPGTDGFETCKKDVLETLLTQCCSLEEMKKQSRPMMDSRQFQMMFMLLQMNPDLVGQLGMNQRTFLRELERKERSKELEKMTAEEKTTADREKWTAWLEKYTARLQQEASMVDNLAKANEERKTEMNNSNPRFILRNYIAQNAIEAAEKGDFSEVRRVLELLKNPFSETVEFSDVDLKSPAGTSASTSDDDATAGAVTGAASKKDCEVRSYTGVAYDSKPPDWASNIRVT